MKRRYFATEEEIALETVKIDINAAIRELTRSREGGKRALDQETLKAVHAYCPDGGPVIYCAQDGTQQVITSDSHSVTFASTGRGKTRRYVYPLVYSDVLAGNNIIVNDMKGEIYKTTRALLDMMGYKTFVLDLRKPGASPHCFNPLTMVWDAWQKGEQDSAFTRLRNFALSMFDTLSTVTDDAFWSNSAVDYFLGLALCMLETGVTRDEFTLESIAFLDREGMGTSASSSSNNKVKELYSVLPETSLARQFLSGTIGAPNETRASILSVFRQPISLYTGLRELMDILGRSDFTIEELTEERRALFIISPDETHSLGPIVVGILNQIMSVLITVAQDKYNGILPTRIDFILDEMGNLPARIPDMDALISASRSRNMRFHIVLQSASQLEHVYGKQLKDVILDNCDTWIFMGSRGLDFLRLISDLSGEVILESHEKRPLLTVDKLQRLETRDTETETLVFMSSLRPYVAALRDIGTYEAVVFDGQAPEPHSPHAERPLYNGDTHRHALIRAKIRGMMDAEGPDSDVRPLTIDGAVRRTSTLRDYFADQTPESSDFEPEPGTVDSLEKHEERSPDNDSPDDRGAQTPLQRSLLDQLESLMSRLAEKDEGDSESTDGPDDPDDRDDAGEGDA